MRSAAQTLFLIPACVALLAVFAILRPDAFFSSQTFINESDTTQTLELRSAHVWTAWCRGPPTPSAAAGSLENRSACLRSRPNKESAQDNSCGWKGLRAAGQILLMRWCFDLRPARNGPSVFEPMVHFRILKEWPGGWKRNDRHYTIDRTRSHHRPSCCAYPHTLGRGRDVDCSVPPAQIRTGALRADEYRVTARPKRS